MVVGDQHDDRRIAAREVRQAARRALPDMSGVDDFGVLAAVRAVRVYAVPVGQSDHVDRHAGFAVVQYGADLAESGVRLVGLAVDQYGEHRPAISGLSST